jgi:D-threo-aldose 1-dehydrogenase
VRIGLGTAALGRSLPARERLRLIEVAFDAGIRYFDTAPLYGAGAAEEALGRFRGDVEIATKVGIVPPGLVGLALRRPPVGGRFFPADVRAQFERSLRRLRRDRVDVLLLHEVEALTPELIETVESLRAEERIGCWGIATGGAAARALLPAHVPDVVQLAYAEAMNTNPADLVLHSVLVGRVGPTPAAELLQAAAQKHPGARILVGSRDEVHIREAAAALG